MLSATVVRKPIRKTHRKSAQLRVPRHELHLRVAREEQRRAARAAQRTSGQLITHRDGATRH